MASSQEEIIPQSPEPICWASCLGDCSSEHSREHILTKAAIPGPHISIEGFPFQAGKTLTIHKAYFSSNILCRYHNNNLSSIDQAGISACDAFKDGCSDTPRKRSKIRGDLFERWLLKTLINIEILCNFRNSIPPELVEMAYGRRPFVPNSGMFAIINPNVLVTPEDRITYIRLHDPTKNDSVPAGHFIVCGFHFLLALGPFSTDRPVTFENRDGTIEVCRLMHHPAKFNFPMGGNVVMIDWKKHVNTRMRGRRRRD